MLWLQSVREELIEKVNALYNNEKKLQGVHKVPFFCTRKKKKQFELLHHTSH